MTKFGIQIIKSDNDTFIDDLTCKTDYEIPKYYRIAYNENSEILGTPIKFQDLIANSENSDSLEESSKVSENKENEEKEEKEENKEKEEKEENKENNDLSTGAIIAIALSGGVVIASSIILIVYIIKKKKTIVDTVVKFNNAELEEN